MDKNQLEEDIYHLEVILAQYHDSLIQQSDKDFLKILITDGVKKWKDLNIKLGKMEV